MDSSRQPTVPVITSSTGRASLPLLSQPQHHRWGTEKWCHSLWRKSGGHHSCQTRQWEGPRLTSRLWEGNELCPCSHCSEGSSRWILLASAPELLLHWLQKGQVASPTSSLIYSEEMTCHPFLPTSIPPIPSLRKRKEAGWEGGSFQPS